MNETDLTADIRSTESTALSGRTIVHCLTGSVAVMKAPEISRLLIRHGAAVQVVMTKDSVKLIGSDLMEWATGIKPITELTGRTEHIEFCGVRGKANLVLIAPCTANTIGKIASGIDDTPVTTFVSAAIGSKIPVVIAAAMHEPMYENQIVSGNVQKLKEVGVTFVEPMIEESKAKMAGPEEIVEACISQLHSVDLKGKRILVTAGATVEHIDPVRVLTNESSGKMGIEIASECKRRGADVTLVHGRINESPPAGIRSFAVKSTQDLKDEVEKQLKKNHLDVFFGAGAPSDFRLPKPYKEKIPTRKNERIKLELVSTPKVISIVKSTSPSTKLVAFKAESDVSEDRLIASCKEVLTEARADMVIGNDVGVDGVGFGSTENQGVAVFPDGKVVNIPRSSKREFARKIIDLFLSENSTQNP